MILQEAVTKLKAAGPYKLVFLPSKQVLNVHNKKSNRTIVSLEVRDDEVSDDYITYLVAEAELLNQSLMEH